MQQEIQEVIDRFHRKMEKDENLRKEVEPLTKSFNLDLGTESYSLKLKDAKIYYFEPGRLEDADVTVTTTPARLCPEEDRGQGEDRRPDVPEEAFLNLNGTAGMTSVPHNYLYHPPFSIDYSEVG